jgi:mono/diheme cytochrome c family protein
MRGIANQIIFLAAFMLVMAAGKAVAQPPGQQDFLRDCAECHGTDGRGAQPEKRSAPGYISIDLTQISKHNGGEFPRQQVYDAIDGSHRIVAHFRGDMPRWGRRYNIDEKDQPDAEQRVRQRISALVDFIQSIQEK